MNAASPQGAGAALSDLRSLRIQTVNKMLRKLSTCSHTLQPHPAGESTPQPGGDCQCPPSRYRGRAGNPGGRRQCADAAVAVSAALAVVEPYGSGLGGGGFFLLRKASSTPSYHFLDAANAPLAATADLYLRNGQAEPNLSLNGALAAAIPPVCRRRWCIGQALWPPAAARLADPRPSAWPAMWCVD